MKEILWEVTLNCNKGCKYCGSKEAMKNFKDCSSSERMKICDEIISLKPQSIDLTGGEPSSLPQDELYAIISKLSDAGIETKILTNGNLFNLSNINEICSKVKCIGYSINEENDIAEFHQRYNHPAFKKTTMITNFGTHNIGLFDELAKTATNFSGWQIQLTIAESLSLDLEEIKSFLKNIEKYKGNPFTQIILADNLTAGKCEAGNKTCGILSNGDIVPCLSYRGWNNMYIQGNCLTESLIDIVEKMKASFANKKHKLCCKDATGILKILKQPKKQEGSVFRYGVGIPNNNQIFKPSPLPENAIVTMYGVQINDGANDFLPFTDFPNTQFSVDGEKK